MSRHKLEYELKRKCAKCNITAEEDRSLSFHRFPVPGRHTLKARVWAEYCYPTGDWSTEKSLRALHSRHKMLCSKHFDNSSFTSSARVRLNNYAIPIGTQDLVLKFRQEQCAITSGSKQDTTTRISVEKPQGNKELDWQQREQELLKKIEELEKVRQEKSEDALRLELKVREEEIDLLKLRVKNLETELQAALSKPGGKNHELIEKIKQQHEGLMSKARGMIFYKTKMVKNQELLIEALSTQVQSLKDINQITKDLLEIRNSEVRAMEDRLQVMESRFKAEKERYYLVLKRAATSNNINDDLRREYET